VVEAGIAAAGRSRYLKSLVSIGVLREQTFGKRSCSSTQAETCSRATAIIQATLS